MSEAVRGVETDNGTGRVSPTVTCNWCSRDHGGTNRKWTSGGEVHCTSCHGFGHRACIQCGACMTRPFRVYGVLEKDGSLRPGTESRHYYGRTRRLDQQFCSTTCRVHGMRQREKERIERQIWEQEHPEETAQRKAEEAAIVQRIKQAQRALGDDKRAEQERQRRERKANPRCSASILLKQSQVVDGRRIPAEFRSCNAAFDPSDVIYLRRHWGDAHLTGPVEPYCQEHRCGQGQGRHNSDAPPGRYYPDCGCDDNWWQFARCPGCNHPIAHHKNANWLRGRDWSYHGEKDRQKSRAFCSTTCKANVLRVERRAEKLAMRSNRLAVACIVCTREFTPVRAGATYCKNACRQRAYRQRTDARP
jgi:hypothetical protein